MSNAGRLLELQEENERLREECERRSKFNHARAKIIDRMRAALREIEEWADDRADVDDGRPNDAMRLLVIVRAALSPSQHGGQG